jgi:hypothetical protein
MSAGDAAAEASGTASSGTWDAPGAAGAAGNVGACGPAGIAGACGPVAWRAETRPHSAHKVRPNDAFSTLQPVTTRPSPVSPAAPTRSREYGAYARLAASAAAARNAAQSMVT